MICKPSGSSSRFSAAGTDMAGRPARLAGTANTSFRYMASGSAVFSPSPNAADGAVGARITSHVSNAAVKRSEEHTSELQSLMRISYAVFCLKKKKNRTAKTTHQNEKQE